MIGAAGDGLTTENTGLTPVPIVHECVDAGTSKMALEDFSHWKPEGDWPAVGPKHRIAVFAGVYNHVVDGVALTCNRLVAYLLSQGHEVSLQKKLFIQVSKDQTLSWSPDDYRRG